MVTVYKACRVVGDTHRSCALGPLSMAGTSYPLGETVVPPKGFGPPLVFGTPEQAKIWGPLLAYGYAIVVLECEAQRVKRATTLAAGLSDSEILAFWTKGYRVYTGRAPKGSLWAYGLVPRRVVWRTKEVT